MTTPLPDPNIDADCWPVDTSCCDGWDDYDFLIQDRATMMATRAMRSLTAYRVGGCPITVRPCATGCEGAPMSQWGSAFYPINYAGTWTNCGCVGGCLHNALELVPPVGEVVGVNVDGEALVEGDWRLLNGKYLIRSDGERWPVTNDMTLPDTEVGTWSVTFLNAYKVDALGAYAAGILACEFAKACSGAACRLPNNVTQVVRQGLTMTILPGTFPGGVTGIREVDAYVRTWNPQRFTTAPAVWSPQQRKPVTWQ